jgi:hypothetical protein
MRQFSQLFSQLGLSQLFSQLQVNFSQLISDMSLKTLCLWKGRLVNFSR